MSWSGYIPSSILRESIEKREEWIANAKPGSGFLRPGSIPIKGSGSPKEHGSKPAAEDYPFQGLDVATTPSVPDWRYVARAAANIAFLLNTPLPPDCAPGEVKHEGRRTPFGTSQATIARCGDRYEDYLDSPCGYCGAKMARCRCGAESALWTLTGYAP